MNALLSLFLLILAQVTLRCAGANTFFYDAENRLTNATVGGTGVSYTYNADGVRVSKTVGGTTTLFLVDDRNPTGYAQVLEELTVTGGTTNLAKVYTYGHDLIAQRIVSTGVRSFFGYDGNGNTRYLTGTNAAVSDTYTYDAFGTQLASTGSTANDYLFAGEQNDPTLGLVYLRARYLNTGTGRFWTRDDFAGHNEDPISLHKYVYAADNPVNNRDPSGNETLVGSITVVGGLQTVNRGLTFAAVVRGAALAVTALCIAEGITTALHNAAQVALSEDDPTDIEQAAACGGGGSRRRIPILYVSRTAMPDIAEHIAQAQLGGHKRLLRYLPDPAAQDANRKAAKGHLPPAGPGLSWDEYPFATTHEGGAGASVARVPIEQQRLQGGLNNGFYRREKLKNLDKFIVVVVP